MIINNYAQTKNRNNILRNLLKMLKVVTYNVLSSFLAKPDYYQEPEYQPENIEFKHRYPKILDKIKDHTKDNAVFCLQELDIVTLNHLQLDLLKLGYNLVYQTYGNKYNGFMGVAIALPQTDKILKIDRHHLASGKNWQELPKVSKVYIFTTKLIKFLSFGYFNYVPQDYFEWLKASYKNNFMLSVEVQRDDKKFLVSTLHMPCEFNSLFTMITYLGLAKSHLQRLINNNNFVLAGDFNIKPNSREYLYLTENKIDHSLYDKVIPPQDDWRPPKCNVLVSAVKQFFGREPNYTNHCYSRKFKLFKDTLDYILVSNTTKVINSSGDNKVDGYCPNKTEPSDHLMVWAEIQID